MLLHMSRATRLTFSLFLIAAGLSTSGCALFENKAGPKLDIGPREQVFFGEFDEVWRATQLALQSPTSYPLRVNNMDTGTIESETIKGSLVWIAPHQQEVAGGGLSYRLVVHVIKGNIEGKNAFKVTISKQASMQRDFFSEPEDRPSDGLEEKVILYRIGREIQIDRAIRKANKKQNKNS